MPRGRVKGAPKIGGRTKGSKNKVNVQREAEIAQSGLTPLDYMLGVLRDDRNDLPIRMQAANSAAPYVHPRLTSVEVGGPNGKAIPIRLVVKFK
jgi:hypothetical protein